MDFLSLLLCLILLWTLVQGLVSITRSVIRTTGPKLPPGPVPFPVIGSLHKLGTKPHKSLAKLAQTYGPIMTLKLGSITTVVISSPSMAREVLQKQDLAFSTRATPDSIRSLDHNRLSVAWIPATPLWRSLRKICNSQIFSSQRLDSNQHLRRQKVEALVSEVERSRKAGLAVDIGRAAFVTSINLLSNTVFSRDMANPSSEMAGGELKMVVMGIMEEAGKPNLVDFFPLLRKLDPQGVRHRMTVHFGKIIKLFGDMMDERLDLKKGDGYGYVGSNDVLDALVSICEDESEEVGRDHIEHLLLDLFVAGTDTTSNTLEWAMAELLQNPKTLTKAREELEQTIGRGKLIEELDVSRLPYLQAVVKETLRLHPTIPLLLPRIVVTDVQVGGFTVPKGAQVLVNAWAIGRDPGIWENPDVFMPERFLGSEIDVRGHDFELIPFGGGRRICPGLPLAIRMIHLMLGSLLNSFDWKLEDGVGAEDLDMDDFFGISLRKAQPLLAVPIF